MQLFSHMKGPWPAQKCEMVVRRQYGVVRKQRRWGYFERPVGLTISLRLKLGLTLQVCRLPMQSQLKSADLIVLTHRHVRLLK